MNKKIVVLCLSFLTLPVFSASVYQPDAYYFSPGVAYYHFSDKRDLQNAAMPNITVGYVVSEQFSLEGFYGQASTEESPASLDQDARFYAYAAEGVYHFHPESEAMIHPYLLAGLIITNQNDSANSTENTTLLGVNTGLGLEYFVNSNISLFVDARDAYTFSGGQNDWMLNGGIKFLLDSAPEKPEQPIKTDGPTGFYQLQDSSTEG